MKKFLFILLVFSSCHSSRYAIEAGNNHFTKMNVELFSSESEVKFNCLSYLSTDSNLINVYGPLGINLLKVFSRYDSLIIVDIHNKKRYMAKIYNASGSLYSFFNGKFGSNEKHILCNLCSLFVSGIKCTNSEALETMFDYRMQSKKNRQYINCKFFTREETYTAKFKLAKDNINQSLSFSMAKYINFETVYLTSQ